MPKNIVQITWFGKNHQMHPVGEVKLPANIKDDDQIIEELKNGLCYYFTNDKGIIYTGKL